MTQPTAVQPRPIAVFYDTVLVHVVGLAALEKRLCFNSCSLEPLTAIILPFTSVQLW